MALYKFINLLTYKFKITYTVHLFICQIHRNKTAQTKNRDKQDKIKCLTQQKVAYRETVPININKYKSA